MIGTLFDIVSAAWKTASDAGLSAKTCRAIAPRFTPQPRPDPDGSKSQLRTHQMNNAWRVKGLMRCCAVRTAGGRQGDGAPSRNTDPTQTERSIGCTQTDGTEAFLVCVAPIPRAPCLLHRIADRTQTERRIGSHRRTQTQG